jgi:hypothetical protein
MIPKNWYLELEMRRETVNRDKLTQRFKVTYTFEHESPLIDVALHSIRNNIFSEEGSMDVVPLCSAHRASMTIHELQECYNVAKEDHDEEDPRNIQIPETKGNYTVEGPKLDYVVYAKPLRTRRVNIGTKENPKFT